MYQGLLGCPSTSALNNYVNNKLLLNCNITVDDINRAADIYGEAKPIIRGKMSREKEIVHSKIENKSLLLTISERHKNLNLYMDIFTLMV